MRRVVTGLFMSLDGVVESPSSWGAPYFDDELFEWINAGLPEADSILLGRRTYLEFAGLWPGQGSSSPMAEFLNTTPKHVVSSTLETLEWSPASVVRGELGDQIRALKQQPGRNIQIPGSPMLVRSLLRDQLLDELSLAICPLVVGSGMHLFEEEIGEQVPLTLVASRTLRSGVLAVTYHPSGAVDPAAEGGGR
jgi:dihydrofolate reductase